MALAFSTDKLKNDKLLIRNIEALETSGSLIDICVGKTFVLTNGVLKVEKLHIGSRFHKVDSPQINLQLFNFLADLIIMNTDARVEMSDNDHKYVPCGNAIEVSLLNFLVGNNYAVQEQMIRRERTYKLEAKIPFSSDRKRLTVAYRIPESNIVRVVIKGAPEEIVRSCTRERDSSNDVISFDGNWSAGENYLEKVVSDIAQIGLKPLTIAYRDFEVETFEELQARFGNFEEEQGRKALES